MGWPVEQEQACTRYDLAFSFRQPANVFSLFDHARYPGGVTFSHAVEDLIVRAACVYKHTAAVVSDERGIGGSSRAGGKHGKSIVPTSCHVRGAPASCGGYDNSMTMPLAIERSHLRAGMRVALAVSGGADSVALLLAMLPIASEVGLVLSVVHVHHGIRGQAADEDAAFVEALAAEHGLAFHLREVAAPAHAERHGETLEEAARNLRYAVFHQMLEEGLADAVLTAHTLDDQAETVLLKLIRGAWTEGLSGIHPVVTCQRGMILRPMLGVRRAEIEAWLRELGQGWREDVTNADVAYARNRVRHELLPELATYNPQIAVLLSHVAELAREEEAYWQREMDRLLPGLLLPGRAVRGGGRAVSTQPGEASLGMELERLRALVPAVRRRVLREAARRMGVSLSFDAVARLMGMVEPTGGKASPRREQLTARLRAERTPRELRLLLDGVEAARPGGRAGSKPEPVEVPIPGEVDAPGYGLRVVAALRAEAGSDLALEALVLRTPRAGDRVRLRYTSGKKSIKDVFSRLRLDAARRREWPLIAWRGEIVWMRDVELEPDPTLPFTLVVTALSVPRE